MSEVTLKIKYGRLPKSIDHPIRGEPMQGAGLGALREAPVAIPQTLRVQPSEIATDPIVFFQFQIIFRWLEDWPTPVGKGLRLLFLFVCMGQIFH